MRSIILPIVILALLMYDLKIAHCQGVDSILLVTVNQNDQSIPYRIPWNVKVTLKAIIRNATSNAGYIIQWDLDGDGQFPLPGDPGYRMEDVNTAINGVPDIGVEYISPVVSVPTTKHIDCKVTNLSTLEIKTFHYTVQVMPFTPDANPQNWTDEQVLIMREMAIQEGLWFLHKELYKNTVWGVSVSNIQGRFGNANTDTDVLNYFLDNGRFPAYPPGVLNDYGFALPESWHEKNNHRWNNDPYAETVLRIMNYQLSTLSTFTLDNVSEENTCGFDQNGHEIFCSRIANTDNNKGIRSNLVTSNGEFVVGTSQILSGLAKCLFVHNGVPVQNGSAGIIGKPMEYIVQEMIDYLVFHQIDNGSGKGGFYFTSDNSIPYPGVGICNSGIVKCLWEVENFKIPYGIIVNNKIKYRLAENIVNQQGVDGLVKIFSDNTTGNNNFNFTGSYLGLCHWLGINDFEFSDIVVAFPTYSTHTRSELKNAFQNYLDNSIPLWTSGNKIDNWDLLDHFWENGDYLSGVTNMALDQEMGSSYNMNLWATGMSENYPDIQSIGNHDWERNLSIHLIRGQTKETGYQHHTLPKFGDFVDDYCLYPSISCYTTNPARYWSSVLSGISLTKMAGMRYPVADGSVSSQLTTTGSTLEFKIENSLTRTPFDLILFMWDVDKEDGLAWENGINPDFFTSNQNDTFNYSYENTGSYTATLLVMDNRGHSALKEFVIDVFNTPSVLTIEPVDISEVTAVAGGNVVDNGGLDVSLRGLAYTKDINNGGVWTEIPFGLGMGSFTAMIEGLEPGTTYYIKAFVTSSAGTGYGEMYSFTTVEKYECPPQMLFGGRWYQSITAGEQCWMKQSLSVGQMINSSSQQTNDGIIEKYCQNNQESNCITYGGLYSWYEMMQYGNQAGAQGICPGNWHIPDDEEWKTLEGTADSQYEPEDQVWDGTNWRGFDAGKNLKSVSGWETNSGSDFLGFTALPGGSYGSGSFYHLGSYAFFWTSTESGSSQAWHRSIFHQYNEVYRMAFNKTNAYSVRCVKNSGEFAAPPVVATLPANTISLDSASVGGNVTGDGGAIIFERGIYWGYQPNPVANGVKLVIGDGTGEYYTEIGPMLAGATCYVKAYARNYAGTGYGQEVSFYISPYLVDTINVLRGGPSATNPLAIPVQITGVNATPYNTNLNSWTGGWQAPQAVYDQGAFVNDPDFWSNIQGQSSTGSTWNNPQPGTGYGILVVDMNEVRHLLNISVFQMFADGKTTHIAFAGHPETGSTPPGAFHGSWSEILPKSPVGAGSNFNTYIASPGKFMLDASTRYVKIMVWNDGSLGYPGYIELKGIKMYAEKFIPSVPVVNTAVPAGITVSSAIVGGNVSDDGGSEVNSRGVYWGTESNPQNTGTQLPIGSGAGEFSTELTGLDETTTYYVAAFASNALGTAFGDVVSFNTLTIAPIHYDSLALVALYNGTDGLNWTNNTNWLSAPLSTWFGITMENGRVKTIDLSSNNLTGTLPAELGFLTELKELTLDYNQISGNIPPETGSLSNLERLYLKSNQLSGSIPSTLGQLSNLILLNLSVNELSGTLPPELGSLQNLTEIVLFENQLTGAIPPQLGNLQNLEILYLSNNSLSGNIPVSLGTLSNLTGLYLSSNQLSGSIPDELGNLSSLIMLDLGSNQLSGEIPFSLHWMWDLMYLYLGDNQLEDVIPGIICNEMLNLQHLTLHNNNFGEASCEEINCLINRQEWEVFIHSPQNNGFTFPDDCYPCENAISDAWGDNIICEDQNVLLYGYAENFTSTLWETSGDGYFADPLAFNTQYFPGTNDILEGNVTFYFTAFAVDPCLDETSGTAVEIIKSPSAYAGPDATTGFNQPYTLNQAIAGNYGALLWETTNGSGTFDDTGILHPTYTPSASDYLSGCIKIVLNAMANDPCTASAFDEMFLCFNSQNIAVPAGWSGISSYLLPVVADVEEVLAPFLEDLVIMSNFDGIYFPGENINTLGNWDIGSGYQIKALAPFQINISGENFDGTDLWKVPGWSFLPVLSSCEVDVEELFQLNYNLIIAKEVAGPGVYWPEYNINTIGALQPGKAYFIYLADDEQISFPDCETGWTCGDPLLDIRDGQSYSTVQIGGQCWMAENINTGNRVDSELEQFNNNIIEKFCYDDDPVYCDTYGGLYLWDEAMQYATTTIAQGICPDGWHMPSEMEWCELEQFVDPVITCNTMGWRGIDGGGKLKEEGTMHWQDPNSGATNESEFSALPGGCYNYQGNGSFEDLTIHGYWWATEWSSNYAMSRNLENSSAQINRNDFRRAYGFSVRCIKDEILPNQPPEVPSNPNPTDGAQNVSTEIEILWECTDPENDPLTYDFYFGTSNPPELHTPNFPYNNLILVDIEPITTFYWKVVANDDHQNATEGPVWNFTTCNTLWSCGDPFIDNRDGQSYTSVQIGDQCWMAENLNSGSMINGINNQINNDIIEKYCYDDDPGNCDVYGGLYQWNEMMQYTTIAGTMGICPEGWYIPNDEEWMQLEGTVDSQIGYPNYEWNMIGWRGFDVGYNLKSSDVWLSVGQGSDLFNFKALPGGFRYIDGEFWNIQVGTDFWTSSLSLMLIPWERMLFSSFDESYRNFTNENLGLSIRCIKDN